MQDSASLLQMENIVSVLNPFIAPLAMRLLYGVVEEESAANGDARTLQDLDRLRRVCTGYFVLRLLAHAVAGFATHKWMIFARPFIQVGVDGNNLGRIHLTSNSVNFQI